MPQTPSSTVERAFALWRAAMRWQAAVDAALRPLGLTHTQYFVLAATAAAIRQEDDAVAQFAVAERAGLSPSVVSTLMRKLDARGLIDRGVDGLDCRRWRVILTQRGRSLLEKATSLVEATAVEVARREVALGRR